MARRPLALVAIATSLALSAFVPISAAHVSTVAGGQVPAWSNSSNDFVAKSGSTLTLGGEEWQFSGLNVYNANSDGWCGAQLGSGPGLDRALTAFGPRLEAIRSWFFQPLAINKGTGQRDWSAFDHTLATAAAHGIRVIATLTDQWGECGTNVAGNGEKTRDWYVSGYRSVQPGMLVSYRDWVEEVVARYANDPRIAFWQLINEAEVRPCPPGDLQPFEILRDWATDVSAVVKANDTNHLVSLGTIGSGQCGADGPRYKELHAIPTIDLCEFHDYGSPTVGIPGDEFNGLQLRIDQCASLNKPLFVGEVGIKPSELDGTYEARADAFQAKLTAQFQAGVQGFLAWAWSPQDTPASTPDKYDIGPGDPAFDALRGPSLAVVGQTYTEPISITYRGAVTTERGAGLFSRAADQAGRVVSEDGSRVVFDSGDQHMVPGGTNGNPNVYVRDRTTLESIPISTDFGLGGTISADGQFVAYEGGLARQVRVADVDARTWVVASHTPGGQDGNDMSHAASINASGRYVSFTSRASDLVSGDTNGYSDIFLFDRITGEVERISVASDGTQGNGESFFASVSDDGRYVAFRSQASNLVAGDTNASDDVFLRDRIAGTTIRVSVASDGTQANGRSQAPFISSGHFVAFGSEATNLDPRAAPGSINVYIHDLVSGATTWVGAGNEPAISADGRYLTNIGFTTSTMIVVHDLWQGDEQFVAWGDNGFGVDPTGRFVAVASGSVARLTDLDAPADTTAPIVGDLAISPNPVSSGDKPQLTAIARDTGRGIAEVETFIDADPGEGNGDGATFTGYNPAQVDTFPSLGSPGSHEIFVRARDNAGNWGPAASIVIEVSPPGGRETAIKPSADDEVLQLVTTDPDLSGASASDAVETVMVGLGSVSIDELPLTAPNPPGYTLIGQEVHLSSGIRPVGDPIQAYFRLDASLFPAGTSIDDVKLFFGGAAVPACAGDPDDDPRANPDPCVPYQYPESAGDGRIYVFASHAAVATFGLPVVTTTAPGAPTGVTAAAGDTRASVSWNPPASDGGSAITGYTVSSSGGQTATVGGSATTAIVSGLTNGVSYTFTVRATNPAGTGSPSAPSPAVTPTSGAQAATATIPAGSTGSASTDAGGGPTASDPFTTVVSVPATANGGSVSITEAAPSGPAPTGGYQFLGQQAVIVSTSATDATNPLTLVFTIDETAIRAAFGLAAGDPLPDPSAIDVSRGEGTGTPSIIPVCTSSGGGGAPIAPAPACLSDRAYVNGTDLRLTVLAASASRWSGVVKPIAVSVLDKSFKPASVTVGLGNAVIWTFPGGRAHSVTESGGLGPTGQPLFDSGVRTTGRYGRIFVAAGTYGYRSTAKGDPTTMTGTVAVPVQLSPATGSTGTTFVVRWSSTPLPGYVFDVRYRFMKAGTKNWSGWTSWINGQSAPSATFIATLGIGTYAFEARLRNSATGRATGWSPDALMVVR